MMKNKIVTIMIISGMTIILTILTIVVMPAIVVARNGRLAIELTILIKSINEVVRGNVKRSVCMHVYYLSYYI